ncbi:MAG: glycosyltransferase family 8 protein [Candidatus Omnitrophica bacterium]|nr:glycosyltransferase family 8 protein [Candidatus Omnitrophota bacterium]
MNDKNRITIACINNNEYTIFTAVMLESLFANYKGSMAVDVYFIHDNLTTGNKEKLEYIVKKHNATAHFVFINEVMLRNLKIPDIYAKLQVHYYKLIIPYVLPAGIKRVIFLDSDMVILEDIGKLWDVDLGNSAFAAAQDSRIRVMSHDQAIRNYRQLGIPAESHYHNTGVMLIDMNKWRNDKISATALECLEVNKNYVHNREQYALNVVCLSAWKELDGRWNQFPEETKLNPYILHFAGWWVKVFTKDYKNIFPKAFLEYAAKTKWGRGTVEEEIERRVKIREAKVFIVKILRFLKLKK